MTTIACTKLNNSSRLAWLSKSQLEARIIGSPFFSAENTDPMSSNRLAAQFSLSLHREVVWVILAGF